MVREYSPGQNQLPQSSIGRGRYPFLAQLKAGETTSDVYSVFEIDSYNAANNTYITVRPSEDNIPASRIMYGVAEADAEDIIQLQNATNDIFWVSFDDTEGEPELGDMVGTLKDSYKMSMHRFGFECLKYDSTNSLCLVRAQAFMPTLVQTVTSESGGEIDVKFVLADGTLVGDAFTVKVLPE